MLVRRTLVAALVFGSALVACSAAPDGGAASSDEALRNCGTDCGGTDPGSPPTPTSGATCPSVNPGCWSQQLAWSQFPAAYQALNTANCNAPIAWTSPMMGENLALCPNTTAVANWVAQHGGAREVSACDTCLPRAGRGSVWVRLDAAVKVDCGTSNQWCLPNCPSGCGTVTW
jgi:hypothetical protein